MTHFIWNIDPVLIHLGPLKIRWYGLFFVGSFFIGLMLGRWMYQREGRDPAILDTLLIYLLAGTVIGARLMHCFAYEPDFYLSHPLEIFKVWKGGLASHGGLIGVIIAAWIFCRRYNEDFLWLLSRTTIPGALTASFIRLGNFFNSEILGKPSDLPWAVIFERVDMIPRHPVQLYESLAYLLLFLVLLGLYKRLSLATSTQLLPGLFFTYVFGIRFFLEFFKTKQADYTWNLPLTTGQALSLPFILIGVIWFVYAYRKTAKK